MISDLLLERQDSLIILLWNLFCMEFLFALLSSGQMIFGVVGSEFDAMVGVDIGAE